MLYDQIHLCLSNRIADFHMYMPSISIDENAMTDTHVVISDSTNKNSNINATINNDTTNGHIILEKY